MAEAIKLAPRLIDLLTKMDAGATVSVWRGRHLLEIPGQDSGERISPIDCEALRSRRAIRRTKGDYHGQSRYTITDHGRAILAKAQEEASAPNG